MNPISTARNLETANLYPEIPGTVLDNRVSGYRTSAFVCGYRRRHSFITWSWRRTRYRAAAAHSGIRATGRFMGPRPDVTPLKSITISLRPRTLVVRLAIKCQEGGGSAGYCGADGWSLRELGMWRAEITCSGSGWVCWRLLGRCGMGLLFRWVHGAPTSMKRWKRNTGAERNEWDKVSVLTASWYPEFEAIKVSGASQ